jgi:hypothetical protein
LQANHDDLRFSIADLRFNAGVQCPIVNRKSQIVKGSRFRFRLAEAGDFVAGFALASLFEQGRAFKTLENIALAAQGGGRAETAML